MAEFAKVANEWGANVQEPVKPTWRRGLAFCGKCGIQLRRGFKYCPDCGRAVKWE